MAVVDLNPLCELFNGHSQEGCELRLVWRERDSEQEPIRTDEGQVLVQFETRGRHQRFAVSIERRKYPCCCRRRCCMLLRTCHSFLNGSTLK